MLENNDFQYQAQNGEHVALMDFLMLQNEYGRDAWAWRIGCALFWGSR